MGRRVEDSKPTDALGPRAAGVLLHLTSLPSAHGIGDLGATARAFAEWLAHAGARWWQMLPVGPIGRGFSPYSSLSAFAGEELFLDLDALRREGLLERAELRAPRELARGEIDYAAARAFKRPLLRRAWQRFERADGERDADYRRFVERASDWLEPYAELSPGDPRYHRFVQFQFDRQWRALRAFCAERGVQLLGDLPIFVVLESVDVRAHPELFRLDRRGKPTVVTGVPPDAFSSRGQRWGHPHYDWDAHRRTGFAWWLARFERAFELFDAVRVDHFIGFHRAWEVPAKARDARRGKYALAPGHELLTALRARRGELPIVAEDLGLVTPEVHALREAFGLPGMRVLQFGFDGGGYHLPHRHPPHSVCYTGTHDNDTARGWFDGLGERVRARVAAYCGATSRTVHRELAHLAFDSPARLALVPMQDLLGLGTDARMNRPGVARGNWRWRMAPHALRPKLAAELRGMLDVSERLGIQNWK